LAEEGEEGAVDGADLAADAAVVAEDGQKMTGVLLLVGSRVGGGEHLIVETGGQRDGVRAMDSEIGSLGHQAGEDGVFAVVLGCSLGLVQGETLPVFWERDFLGIEAVLEIVAGGAGLAFGGAGAGGFAGVGAVGGEALFGDGGCGGHGYLRRLNAARWRLADWKERLARVRSASTARKAGSSWT
jgi:hypothetical protein